MFYIQNEWFLGTLKKFYNTFLGESAATINCFNGKMEVFCLVKKRIFLDVVY